MGDVDLGGRKPSSQPHEWVSYPANYIFVGFSNRDYGEGSEIFQQAPAGGTLINSSLIVNVTDGRLQRASDFES